LNSIWVQRGQVSSLLPCAKEKLIIFVVYQIPRIFNGVIAYILVRCIAVIISVLFLLVTTQDWLVKGATHALVYSVPIVSVDIKTK
jgi:hypothetical protein